MTSTLRHSLFLAILLSVAGVLAAGQTPAPRKGAGKRPAAASAQVEELRQLVQAQQEQITQQGQQVEQLKTQVQQLLEASQQANAATQKGQSTAEQAQAAAIQAQQSATTAQQQAQQASANAAELKTALSAVSTKEQDEGKKLSALEGLVGRFRFTGDVRVRGESFSQQGVADRNRARIRGRFGIEGKLGEDFLGGAAIATGGLGDLTSTNETFTNFFDRKTIALDKAYIIYQPVAHKWLQLAGGKFVYTWNRTGTTGDQDINPEGFSQKFSFDLGTPLLKNVTFQTMQLLFNEVTGGTDSYAIGGQVSSKFQLGPLTTTPSFLLLKWNKPDAILQASAFAVGATTTTGGLPVPGEGPGCARGSGLPTVPPCAFGANGMTNATVLDANNVPHFYSRYFYADFILNNQIKTPWARFPINLTLEYENNLDAQDHPLDSTGAVLTGLGKQSHVYYADFNIGQTKNKSDFQIGYVWYRQEQDAVISSFAESDQRAPTNLLQNKWYFLWKLRANTVAQYTFWYGHTLNSSLQHAALATGVSPGLEDPYLRRMQFDLIYTF